MDMLLKNKKSFCVNAGNPLSTCVIDIGGGGKYALKILNLEGWCIEY